MMPMTMDMSRTSRNATPIGRLFRTQKPAKKMDTMPMIEEMDISISPIRMTKNSPMAMIATNEA